MRGAGSVIKIQDRAKPEFSRARGDPKFTRGDCNADHGGLGAAAQAVEEPRARVGAQDVVQCAVQVCGNVNYHCDYCVFNCL